MITEVEDGTGCNYPHGCTVGVLNSFISHEKLVSFKNPWIWEQMFYFAGYHIGFKAIDIYTVYVVSYIYIYAIHILFFSDYQSIFSYNPQAQDTKIYLCIMSFLHGITG